MSETALGPHIPAAGRLPASLALPDRRLRSRAATRSARLLGTLDLVAALGALAMTGTGLPGWAFVINLAVLLWHADAYVVPLELRPWRHATRILSRSALALLLPIPLLAVVVLDGQPTGALLSQAYLTAGFVQLGRVAGYAAIRRLRVDHGLIDSAVVIGAGQLAQDLAEALNRCPEYGLEVVGALDEADADGDLRVVDKPDRLPELLEERQIKRVLLAYGPFRDASIVTPLRRAAVLGADVDLVPRLYEAGASPDRPEFEHIRGIPLYRLHRAAPYTRSWSTKRIFDLAFATAMGLAALPAMAVLALAVRLSSPGPVLFRQTRVGQRGAEFELLKFRSMRVNDDSDETWNVAGDDRVTGVGRFMRRTSLDELPQLWNVIRGDMGIVGPRPERPRYVDEFAENYDGYDQRHRLPVGLTGWAQVNDARGDTPIDERARLDNHWIDHWSLWRDVRIILSTGGVVLGDIFASDRER